MPTITCGIFNADYALEYKKTNTAYKYYWGILHKVPAFSFSFTIRPDKKIIFTPGNTPQHVIDAITKAIFEMEEQLIESA